MPGAGVEPARSVRSRGFLDHWLAESVKSSVPPATYQQYHQHVRLYLGPSLGRHRLSKLSPQHVQTFVNERLKSDLSPRTVQLSLVILRHALQTGVKWGLVGRNVAKLVDTPKVRRPEIKPLDLEQSRKFLDAAKGERLEALYSVALGLGLREGEALGLRWIDLDLERQHITIRQSLQRVGGKRFGTGPGKLQLVEPKTDRSRRTLRIPDALFDRYAHIVRANFKHASSRVPGGQSTDLYSRPESERR